MSTLVPAAPAAHPLAGRLERIEALAYADAFRAAPPGAAVEWGVAVGEADGAVLMRAAALAGERTFNRAMGLGAPGADLERQIREVRRFFGGLPHIVSLDPAAPAESAAALARHGYAPGYAWDKFVRDPVPAGTVPSDLAVREAGPADAGAFGAVVAGAFGLPGVVAGWIGALAGRPGWLALLAEDRGEPVAGAALFVAEETAWLGLGGTLPAHRGRGAQGALFAARIAAALAAGCTLLVTETGAPREAGPGPSYRNMLRFGFRPVYRRPNHRSG
jgi:GNAT superfamily N-acetyltransferase